MADGLAPSAVQTVLLGVSIYVVGQVVQRFLMEPIQEQRRIIGEIASARLLYANIAHAAQIASDPRMGAGYLEDATQASRALRSLASRLRATERTIPFYRFWAGLRLIPRPADVQVAAAGLVGWSNSLYSGQPGVHRDKVVAALRLPAE